MNKLIFQAVGLLNKFMYTFTSPFVHSAYYRRATQPFRQIDFKMLTTRLNTLKESP